MTSGTHLLYAAKMVDLVMGASFSARDSKEYQFADFCISRSLLCATLWPFYL